MTSGVVIRRSLSVLALLGATAFLIYCIVTGSALIILPVELVLIGLGYLLWADPPNEFDRSVQ